MWMVTNYSGAHWCDEPQIFDTYEAAEKCAKEVSRNGHSSHRVWKLEATTTMDTSVSVKRA